jgi:hypothetical protein
MASLIYLRLGRLELDWSKNSISTNHSVLFSPADVHKATYYYVDDIVEEKPAFVRSLHTIVRRLDLLGFTVPDCERMYKDLVDKTPSYYDRPSLSFEQFAQVMTRVDVDAVGLPEGTTGDYDLGEFCGELLKDPACVGAHSELAKLTRDDFTFFENLHPYLTLRLLAEKSSQCNQGRSLELCRYP